VSDSFYAKAFPWKASSVERVAGWHRVAFYGNADGLKMYIDGVLIDETAPTELTNIFIHGGNVEGDVEGSGMWDALFVTLYDSDVSLAMGEFEVVITDEDLEWMAPSPASSPSARMGAAGVVYEDSLWVFGGERSSYFFTDLYEYEFGKDDWDFVAYRTAGPTGRYGAAMAAGMGEVFVYGGRGDEVFGDMWSYNIEDNSWSEVAVSPGLHGRFGAGAAVIDSTLFVFGGYVGNTSSLSNELWAMDLETGKWTLLGPRTGSYDNEWEADPSEAILFPQDIPSPRMSMVMDVVDGKLFISGGVTGALADTPIGDAWLFEPSSKTYTLLHKDEPSLARFSAVGGCDAATHYCYVSLGDSGSSVNGTLASTAAVWAGVDGNY
jgi:hypothetical protein